MKWHVEEVEVLGWNPKYNPLVRVEAVCFETSTN